MGKIFEEVCSIEKVIKNGEIVYIPMRQRIEENNQFLPKILG